MPPLFSVILPTRDRAATLGRAIASVLRQSAGDFELIVIDDGSSDATAEVLGRFAPDARVRVERTEPRGSAAARNRGAALARGRYLAFQDSDDEWVPDKLARAREVLEKADEDVAVCYGDMMRVRPDGSTALFPAPRDIRKGRLIDEATGDFQVVHIGIQSAVIRRDCFEAAGGFDEAFTRYIDMELFVRLALNHRFVHGGEAVAVYYEGTGISKNRAALVAARRRLILKYGERLRESPEHLARQYLLLSTALERNGQKLRSMGWALRAWALAPSRIGAGELGGALLGRWARVGRVRG
jgi:glycosyltransferase involved in cell wall biosynthesis